MKTNLLVSIIIPTYNSEKTLAKCLGSIKNQTFKNIEVIIVDRFSEDKTIEIAKGFNTRFFSLNCERAKAKNFGVEKAKGRYTCFIDSDMELNEKTIEKCVNLIEKNEKIGGIIIPERSIGNSFWVKVRDFERGFYANTEVESARFFIKDLVERVNGFDYDITFFEESTLPQKVEKLGYDIGKSINSEIFHNEDNFSLWSWLRKKYNYGKTANKYREKYVKYASRQLSVLYRFSIFLKNKKFYSRPHLALGLIFLKFMEYLSSTLGYISIK